MKDTRLTPRIASTARALWTIYVALTCLCALVYWLLGMSTFDAVCHAMSTISTGGFTNYDESIGYFHSHAIEVACVLFMLLGATNFTLHFAAWRMKSPKTYFRDTEFRAFLLIVLGLSTLTVLPLWLTGSFGALDAIRVGVFHLVSYGSSSGFSTVDVTALPLYVPLLIMISSFMVGCAGSTAAGIKVARLVLFLKQAARELQRLLHPNAAIALKFGGRSVPDDIVYAVGGFFSVYVGLTILLTFIMIGTGLEPVTAFAAVAAAINNTGASLGEIATSMAGVTPFGKWLLVVTMVMGRLEIFTFLIVFTPAFWRR